MEPKRRNKIQVYGLPRSGTNFIEWTLNNNFIDISYINLYKTCDSGIKEHGRDIALKHCLPSLNYSDHAIVIYKSYDQWVESMKRDNRGKSTRKIYDDYLQAAKNLPDDKCIIISHQEACDNYIELVEKIAKLFNVTPKDKIIQPTHRMNKAGANAKQTKRRFL